MTLTETPSVDLILKRFEAPDETRVFEKGRVESLHFMAAERYARS